jgi:hypothetical protein
MRWSQLAVSTTLIEISLISYWNFSKWPPNLKKTIFSLIRSGRNAPAYEGENFWFGKEKTAA